MRVSCALLFFAASVAFADPPKLELPAEVNGSPGGFIQVPATTDGKNVSWRAVDSGLNLFPVDLLKSSKVAVVTAAIPGRYRLWAVTAAGDEVSEFAETVVIVGNPPIPVPPTPPPTDPPVDPPPTEPTSLYFLIIRPDGPASAEFTRIMSLPGWNTLTAAGHTFKDKTLTDLKAWGYVPPSGTVMPFVLTLKVVGGVSRIARDPIPLPANDAGIVALPAGVK